MMIATVYIPPQQSRFFNEDEFDLFEQEIASVRSNYDYMYLLGDYNAQTANMVDYTVLDPFLSEFFNFDQATMEHMDQKGVFEKYGLQISRASKDAKKNNHGFKIIELCKNNNLAILNGRFGEDKNVGKMTFRGLSVIDYVITSSKGIKFAQNFKITELDSLFSDGHALLTLDLRTVHTIPNQPTYQQHEGPIKRINPTEYECFKNGVDTSKLLDINMLLSNADRACTPETVNLIVRQICDLFRDGADRVKESRKPKTNFVKRPTDKPWFGAQCKSARRKYFLAKRANRQLRTESSRNSLLRMSKAYKRTLNKHINNYKKSRRNTLRQMQAKEPKKYWNFLNSLKTKNAPETPSVDVFYDFFKEVYSSDTQNDQNNDDTPVNFNLEHSNETLNSPFTTKEISICISKLKNSKSPGHDDILNEYIKLTADIMTPTYVSLFNIILKTGFIPEDWAIGKIRPIYKNKGEVTDPNNYRPITILSCLNKLFTAVLNERLTNFLEDNNLLNENQAGFRKSYATTDHVFSLYALIEIMKIEKKKLFCSFVDFSKAFDSVWRSALWGKLLGHEINGNFLRVLHNIYLNAKSFISVNNQESGFLINNCGLRQGDNISPILFSMYLNDLETFLRCDAHIDAGINGVPINIESTEFSVYLTLFAMLYADDTILISEDAESFQACLNSFYKYCQDWKLTVNESKTKIIIFGVRRTDHFNFKFGSSTIEIVDNYKYLGTIFSKSGSFLNARKHVTTQAKKAMYLLNIRIKNLDLPIDLQLKLFDNTILPILTHGSEIFGFEDCNMLEVIHNQFLRSLTYSRKSTPLYMLFGEFGRYPLEIVIKSRMVGFWNRLLSGKQSKLSYILYRKLTETPSLNCKWVLKVKQILDECGMSEIWASQTSNPHISKKVTERLKDQYLQKWNASLNNSTKGRNYGIFKESIQLEEYFLKLTPRFYIQLAKFRTANHRFPCEVSRWQNVETSENKCHLCNKQDVGDEMHYLLICPHFLEERKKFVKPYYFSRPNILKFRQLLNTQNGSDLKNLCLFIELLMKAVIIRN
ncbi:MAG: reverse transcriptase family protein [Candidatus Thiodiazotropha taylori]|nr:reverse transcriptase family protein [Candidatus Thiodiazotropha taylori]MCW4336218.1 reverse transcriptase family protein [Candidatus Thiodiazotropha endolucinida]